MSWLREHCPRLAKAWEEHCWIVALRARRRQRKRRQLVEIERLVAHRELQYLRAADTRSQGYIALRERKLAEAHRIREHVAEDLRSVDTWEPPALRRAA